jgi:O-acetyl-ADP-ribose deacetylase (regulator of RNase III)
MTELSIVAGDITTLEVDAIVNAANSGLHGGGGVDGAIHHAAGPSVLEECRAILERRGPLEPGEVVATGAGRLASRHILHAVGPIWGADAPEIQDGQLAACYRNSLRLAAELGCESIAFPGISTGVYSFPKDRAARIAVDSVRATLGDTPAIGRVVFTCFDPESERLTREAMARQ